MIAAEANPLLDHAWGISPGADRVWAQIAGIAPSTKPWERLFVVLTEFQAFMDESYENDGVFVMAGYVATAAAWANFSKEWEELLPVTFRDKKGRHRFKMNEMKRRMSEVPRFYSIIKKYVALAIYCE